MYCKSCGQIIDDTGSFCKYCGFSSKELSRGTLLYNGRYEIVDILKSGGMAKVYTCIDRNLCGIYLALKEMTGIFPSCAEK
ncbi:MAG: hypothetical protein ABRQ37_25135, partial [Candidatus Eremiobacterota bacterium]